MTARDDRSETEAELFGLMFLLAQHLSRGADAALHDYGLTGRQWLLLAVLVQRFPDRAPTLTEAADAYGTSRQNLTQLARALERRGYLHLLADTDDRRALRLKLTERHHELDSPAALEAQRVFLDRTFGGLDPHELAALRRLALRILDSATKTDA
ncbi:MAG: MarR family transcriptional regulator [Actinomyces sp.]|jgi:DNA-binding MarR family transcriptional regulator|nr:MarR family transcriptional regulator [Actinomyces sp.]MCI1788211.1 MarR family transcriptional regulator [Actinomyces sp.]MCI1830058.1 MarR family transcriptional regulator [Actinomyces sp.]MCI1866497.1 MarR family transcriptional regulator [Actinomyces sp.]